MPRTVRINLNRVEGDLELEVEIKQGRVSNARCIGTMYRGFEQILLKRDPLDALAITPRICGICGTAHLYATALALESIAGITSPPNGTRIRNACLLAEEIQSDCRQTFLMFTPDLCQPQFHELSDYPSMVQQFEFMKGDIYLESVTFSRQILEIVALFGGQWPHSSYMVPGGVTTIADKQKVIEAIHLVDRYQHWFEKRILGCSLEQWSEITTEEALWLWLDSDHGRNSAAGLFSRFSHQIELHKQGIAESLMMSYGNIIDPDDPAKRARSSGIFNPASMDLHPLNQSFIEEDISHSWFHDGENRPRHPFEGITQPKYEPGNEKYSWAKAPRYNSQVAHTGALPQLICNSDPLMTDLLDKYQNNSWLRQFARIQRQAQSLPLLRAQLVGLRENQDQPHIVAATTSIESGEGYGLIEAARGSLGHWVRVEEGRVTKYQIITPTAWNASPKDRNGIHGHIEQSLIGTPVKDPDNPTELGYIVRSHDPCLVCTVHVTGSDKKLKVGTI